VLILTFGFSFSGVSQQNIFSRSEVGTGYWWNDTDLPWYYSEWGNQNRPDNNGRGNVFIGHNNNLTMTVNGAWFQLRTLTLESGASSSRTFDVSDNGGISLSYGLYNQSTVLHTFNVPIGVDATSVIFEATNGDLSFTTDFYLNANTATFSGDNDIVISGIMSGTNGNVIKSGTGTLTLTENNSYSGGTTINAGILELQGSLASSAITVNSDAKLTINGDVVTVASLTIESGGIVEIEPGKELTVSGTLTNNAGASGLVIKSDATGTGSLITTSTPDATVERYISQGTSSSTDHMYHIVSAPVSGQAVTLFTNDQLYGFFKYDEFHNVWINQSNPTPYTFETEFVVGRGYMVNFKTEQTPAFQGTLQSGTITFNSDGVQDITFTSTLPGWGWNLIGNPYASAINWDAISGWTQTNVDNALYYREGGSWVTYIDGVPNDQNLNIIPVGQGVFVHANAASPGLAMTNDVRVHNSQAYHKEVTVLENLLNISATGNGQTDHAYIHFRDGATPGFDSQYDAYKMFSDNDYYPQVYTLSPDNTELSIDKRTLPEQNTSIPVCFKSGLNGNYTISFSGIGSFAPGAKFLLEDKQTNLITDLKQQPSVQFAYVTADDSQRFILHLEGMVGINEPLQDQPVSVYAFGDKLYIDSHRKTGQVRVEVYNLTGQRIYGNNYSSCEALTVPLQGAQGFYIVKVMGTDFVASQKVYVR